MNLTIADLINELSNLGQIHGPDAPVRVWNTSETIVHPLEVRAVSGVSSGWCPTSNRQAATIRIEEQ